MAVSNNNSELLASKVNSIDGLSLLECFYDGILIKNNDTNEIWLSDSLLDILGYKKESLPNDWEYYKKLIHPEDYHVVRYNFPLTKKKYQINYRVKNKEAVWIPFQITIISVQNSDSNLLIFGHTKSEFQASEYSESPEKQHIKKLFDFSPDAVLTCDLDANITDCNKHLYEMHGYESCEELIGKNAFSLISEDEHEKAKQKISESIENGVIRNVEFKLKKKNGEIFSALITANVIYSEPGNPLGLLFAARDLTQQHIKNKQIEERSKKVEQLNKKLTDANILLENLIESTTEFLLIYDEFGNPVKFNSAYSKIVKELSGIEMKPGLKVHLQHPLYEMRELWDTYHGRALKGEKFSFEIELNNKYFEFTFHPIIQDGKVHGFTEFSRDITERKEREIELAKTKVLLESIIAQSPVPMVIISHPENIILYINNAFNELLGISDEPSRIGKHRSELNPTWKNFGVEGQQLTLHDIPLVRALNGELVKQMEIRVLRKDGTERYALVDGVPILDSKNNIIAAFSMSPDITEQKLAEIALTQSQKHLKKQNEEYFELNKEYERINKQLEKSNKRIKTINRELKNAKDNAIESDKLKSAFLANMSHEIRTPMNGIIGFTELLKNETLDDEKQKQFVNIINDACQQLLRIVNDIISISKIETGQIEINNEQVNLNMLIDELRNFYLPIAKKKAIKISTIKEFDDSDSGILTDATKLRQILDNLISNALKYTYNGKIQIGYEQQNKTTLIIYVKDTGTGIAKNMHKAIFERFRQEDGTIIQHEGTGLGLSISKAFVEKLGGKIWVDSEKDKGSTFTFTLPYEKAVNEKKTQIKHESNKKQKGLVLVVEDEDINFLLLEEILLNMGIHVLRAYTGIEAIEFCFNVPGIKMVFMDLKLPEMNGLEATKKIKEKYPLLPIIAQTAYAMEQDRENAISAGCDDYIPKPIQAELVEEAIHKFM